MTAARLQSWSLQLRSTDDGRCCWAATARLLRSLCLAGIAANEQLVAVYVGAVDVWQGGHSLTAQLAGNSGRQPSICSAAQAASKYLEVLIPASQQNRFKYNYSCSQPPPSAVHQQQQQGRHAAAGWPAHQVGLLPWRKRQGSSTNLNWLGSDSTSPLVMLRARPIIRCISTTTACMCQLTLRQLALQCRIDCHAPIKHKQAALPQLIALLTQVVLDAAMQRVQVLEALLAQQRTVHITADAASAVHLNGTTRRCSTYAQHVAQAHLWGSLLTQTTAGVMESTAAYVDMRSSSADMCKSNNVCELK